ncbi:hypothetical protein F442_19659 [Phytophthora nicotianae P10297]|uniref:Uncharacterized protein n=1 Tax=Phytophthora nicotianae P10297 TaxID=1317064 RepID=W2YA29_PHYNI|nr:hypothetical protein F442_19659 [Phytophthora nicotianae P10297]
MEKVVWVQKPTPPRRSDAHATRKRHGLVRLSRNANRPEGVNRVSSTVRRGRSGSGWMSLWVSEHKLKEHSNRIILARSHERILFVYIT